MKRIPPRHKLLGGALTLALLIWAADSYLGGGPPPAQASPAKTDTNSPEVAAWQDVSELVARLTCRHYTPIADALRRADRDLFLPTPQFEAAFAPAEEFAADAAQEAEPDPAVDFAARHRLVGVLLGKQPLAVIDNHLLAVNAELDGHRLVEVHRDRVVFQRPNADGTVVLELQSGPQKP